MMMMNDDKVSLLASCGPRAKSMSKQSVVHIVIVVISGVRSTPFVCVRVRDGRGRPRVTSHNKCASLTDAT